jgi:hypothetical protein
MISSDGNKTFAIILLVPHLAGNAFHMQIVVMGLIPLCCVGLGAQMALSTSRLVM